MLYHLSPVCKAGTFLLVFLLLFSQHVKANLPENAPRFDITVRFNNIKSLGNYVLHIRDNETEITVYNDTVYAVYASSSAPHRIEVFAELDGVVTESIFFDEYQQYNYVVDFKGISGKSLLYDLRQSPVTANLTAIEGGSVDSKLVRFWKTNEVLIGVSFVTLVGLIIYFVWRKKKKSLGNIDAAL